MHILYNFSDPAGPTNCDPRLSPCSCCSRCCRVPGLCFALMRCSSMPSNSICVWRCPKMASRLCLRFLSCHWPSSLPCCHISRSTWRCRLRYRTQMKSNSFLKLLVQHLCCCNDSDFYLLSSTILRFFSVRFFWPFLRHRPAPLSTSGWLSRH